jgi:hypothetical protein
LALDVGALIVAVGGGAERGAGLVAAGDTPSLCEVLLTLRLADLDLLLLAAAAELVGLERALCLESRATVLGDVFVGHGVVLSTGLRLAAVRECGGRQAFCLEGDYIVVGQRRREKEGPVH